MKKVLVLYAHPNQKHSLANREIVKAIKSIEQVTFVDLYAEYPRFKIDIDIEQERLIEHDIIVFQFPMYWYSTPSILKEWQDVVLEYGFAFGHEGQALKDKQFLISLTTGGSKGAYCHEGTNQNTIRELLQPLERMADLCQMKTLPPLVLFSASSSKEDGRLERNVALITKYIEQLKNENVDLDTLNEVEQLVCDSQEWQEVL